MNHKKTLLEACAEFRESVLDLFHEIKKALFVNYYHFHYYIVLKNGVNVPATAQIQTFSRYFPAATVRELVLTATKKRYDTFANGGVDYMIICSWQQISNKEFLELNQ